MFDVAPTELLLVVVVALVVIGPKDLPKAMRFVGKWVAKARGMARHFRSGLDTMMREAELEELEKQWRNAPRRSRSCRGPDAARRRPGRLVDRNSAGNPRRSAEGRPVTMSADTPVHKEDEDGAGGKMPLLDHLIELRSRLLKSLLAIALAFGVCLYFARPIFGVLVHPLVAAGQGKLIYTQLFEAFFVEIKVALFAAMMIAFPVIANQLWKFVAPGLYRKEQRALLPFLFATPVLFAIGASFAYFITIPIALKFLLGYQGEIGGVTQEALPSVGNYLSFVMQFIMAFGIAFLLPILLMLVERAGLVTRQQLIGARRYMIVAAFAIAAVFTPPDVMSQLLLAVPLVFLYEISIFAIWFTQRRRKTGAEAAPVEPPEEAKG